MAAPITSQGSAGTSGRMMLLMLMVLMVLVMPADQVAPATTPRFRTAPKRHVEAAGSILRVHLCSSLYCPVRLARSSNGLFFGPLRQSQKAWRRRAILARSGHRLFRWASSDPLLTPFETPSNPLPTPLAIRWEASLRARRSHMPGRE